MILLWGLSDLAMSSVARALAKARCPVYFIDQANPALREAQLRVNDDGAQLRVTIGETELVEADVTSAYIRPYETSRLLPATLPAGRDASQRWSEIMWSWAEVTEALVLNRPSAMARCMSKPNQFETITACGFEVPDTLLTTDGVEAEAFWERHESVIYKSTSSVRSIVSRLSERHRAQFERLATCPTQFQQHVAGIDFRVHVVGAEVFCSRIISGADDYRYPTYGDSAVDVVDAELPQAIEDKCRALSGSMQLPLAGIDLRRTVEGRWYCFEINPSPAFSYYDRHAAEPIAAAIVRLLMSPSSRLKSSGSDTSPSRSNDGS